MYFLELFESMVWSFYVSVISIAHVFKDKLGFSHFTDLKIVYLSLVGEIYDDGDDDDLNLVLNIESEYRT